MKSFFLLLILSVACSHIETTTTPPAPDQNSPVTIEILKPVEVSSVVVTPPDVFTTTSTITSLQNAVKIANCVIRNEDFLKEIGSHKQFDFTTMTSGEVEKAFRSIHQINIGSYKTKNPYSKVLATTYLSDRKNVWINSRKLPRPVKGLVNTFVHEGSHLIGFKHGDNSPIGKGNSVPYGIGDLSEKYVSHCESSNK